MRKLSETTAENTSTSDSESNFSKNVANVLHEIVDQLPLRHEWENTRLHDAVSNLDKDPSKILPVEIPLSPTDPNAGLAAEVARLTALVESMAGKSVETPAPTTPAPAPDVSDTQGAGEGAPVSDPSAAPLSGQ